MPDNSLVAFGAPNPWALVKLLGQTAFVEHAPPPPLPPNVQQKSHPMFVEEFRCSGDPDLVGLQSHITALRFGNLMLWCHVAAFYSPCFADPDMRGVMHVCMYATDLRLGDPDMAQLMCPCHFFPLWTP